MAKYSNILFMTEYIQNVLYFATVKPGKSPENSVNTHYFSIDNELVYENYYNDFGPLNLGCVYKYCQLINNNLKLYINKQSIVHYTSTDPKKKANAAFLMGCYGVLYLSLSPKDALKPLYLYGQNYRSFQDAVLGESRYTITLLDCLHAIRKAKELGFFNFNDFDFNEYDRLDKIQGGDLNWIVPGKFLAFIGPVDHSVSLYHPPEMYLDYFKENNVNVVIRLNMKLYDAKIFLNAGIRHHDLFFPDGQYPPRHILFKFLQICEECDGSVGVHCKAGLGRTGSLIGCYLIKHYRMTAHEAIGWMRICRPGSVIGQQQGWLERVESWLIKQGNLYRKQIYQDTEKLPTHEFGVYSLAERTLKVRPVMCQKPSSPMQRLRSSVSPPPRPQASRFRPVLSKTPTKDHHDDRVISSRPNSHDMKHKGDSSKCNMCSKRLSHNSDAETQKKQKTPYSSKQDPNYKNVGVVHPILSYRNANMNCMRTVNDAKISLMGSTFDYKRSEGKSKPLNSAVVVTPHSPIKYSNYNCEPPLSQPQSNYNGVLRGQDNRRRRLGRSPSPSPRIVSEKSRTINTNTTANKLLKKDASVTALREALSRLKCKNDLKVSKPREKSIGAASLGARRDAPAPRRAPSVRSDERSLATQGDLLNSIKFQRRFKDTSISTDNYKRDKYCLTIVKDRPNKGQVNSSTNTVVIHKDSNFNNHSFRDETREKYNVIPFCEPYRNNSRPASPKGRRKVLPP